MLLKFYIIKYYAEKGLKIECLGIGDWGLGIGPIPNPQKYIYFYLLRFLQKINTDYLLRNNIF